MCWHISSIPFFMRRYLLIFVFLLVSPPYVWGFDVSPISAELDVSKQRSHLLTITSKDKEQKPIRVKAVKWQLTKTGQDIRQETSDLILFPRQFVLSPNEKRVVRVGARTTTKPEIEKSYRILIQEVPVALEDRHGTESGVRLITSYATAFYIAPQKPHSDIQLKSVERAADGLMFKLFNNGNAHSHLYDLALAFSQDGKTVHINTDKQLQHFRNENLLAKNERDFSWHWPKDVTNPIDLTRPFNIELTFNCEFCDRAISALTYAVP